jgi:hypothetical protein
MKVIAIAFLVGAALAQQSPQLNPEVLKWQAEAQARERAINRRADFQLSRAPRPASPTRHPGTKPKPVRPNKQTHLHRS